MTFNHSSRGAENHNKNSIILFRQCLIPLNEVFDKQNNFEKTNVDQKVKIASNVCSRNILTRYFSAHQSIMSQRFWLRSRCLVFTFAKHKPSSPQCFALCSTDWLLPMAFLLCVSIHNHMSRLTIKPTKWHVRPANTQISLSNRPV